MTATNDAVLMMDPLPLAKQVGQRELAAEIDRRQVHRLHALPGLETRLEDGVVVGGTDARVVAADVDAAEGGGHRLVEGFHLSGGGDVGLEERAADGGGRGTARLLVQVDHRHLGPLAGEALAHGPSDAAGPTRHDGHAVDQSVGVGNGVVAHGSSRVIGGGRRCRSGTTRC